ncbi:1,4-dihydroxy-2-naphthoate polyprenyltransferase [Tsukamurella soli]|uniref:1,4-dihydroxy-2-naphthoate octaprenyltransferase n=1 Tax=Tsukamurella soli TaxID=644556 RepID=A0ABP8JRW0_9ACTN
MATPAQWLEGSRPRTLPNAIAPVIAGTGAAEFAGGAVWWKAVLAMLVAVALIIGVNFANDYSDGIRGTDDDRVGPLRLVGSGVASPSAVKRAALTCFGVAGVAGIVLSLASAWWLIVVGIVCVAGAWFYTGGKKPYGYLGFGEIAVFVFFGLVAVLGTQFVQAGRVDGAGLLAACAVGCYSSGVLVANNLRDIPTDAESGKITLAVRLGERRTRLLFAALVTVPTVLGLILAVVATPWALLSLLSVPLALRAALPVVRGAHGPGLIPALAQTGLAMVVWALAATVGLFIR